MEEEEEEVRENEVIAPGVIMVKEEEGDMREEGMMLAMGAVEKIAQRP